MNLEHHIERMSLFTIAVLGEVMTAIMWSSKSQQFSSANIGTLCGITIAICIQYVYYYGDGEDMLHSFRAGTLSGIAWQTLHMPLHLAIIISGAAISINVKYQASQRKDYSSVAIQKRSGEEAYDLANSHDASDPALYLGRVQNIFSLSMTIVLITLVFISLLHRQHGKEKRILPHWVILFSRVLVSGIIFGIGYVSNVWSDIQLLEFVCGTWVLMVLVNVLGLQRTGPLQLKESACHFELGKR